MAKLFYKSHRFSTDAVAVIEAANQIIREYAGQGFDLTLRQLYYQFVSRDLLPNNNRSYKRLGSIVNDARLAGLIDWDAIVDRTRNLRLNSHWDEPSDIIDASARQFRYDLWDDQDYYVEVWIEKDALLGVIEGVCRSEDTPYFSCRGYTSQSEMWVASQRVLDKIWDGKKVRVLHLGDHDPSGIDMTRDIDDRIAYFVAMDLIRHEDESESTIVSEILGDKFEINRLALNMDQVREYDPPPNPAKLTDARAQGYIARHGEESWELDALEPAVLAGLITDAIESYRDPDKWEAAVAHQDEARVSLTAVADRWDEVVAMIGANDE